MPSLSHAYDIHGIATVASAARLPELETFRVSALAAPATINVHIDTLPRRRRRHPSAVATASTREIRFDEGFRRLGFGVEIRKRSGGFDVLATPFLRRSPHVLYTNVVEPLLRWAFVDKGFALVHGACLSYGEHAFLITARTDTGKTTTVLRLLDNHPEWSFISDDLTLVAPDGRVFAYPKPLTISRHTLVAVQTPRLSRRERVGLLFQSRLHSRSGRQFGLFLTRSGLPMATTNALVQLVVPPPKYHVQRLIPGVNITRQARLAGLVIIERGPDNEITLTDDQALETLMENCEDSYGFPPYESIKDFLYSSDRGDLRPVERATVASALQGRPAVLLRSETRDWWQRLPALIDRAAVAPRTGWAAAEHLLTVPAMPAPAD